MAVELTHPTFVPQVATPFWVASGVREPLTLTLVEVSERRLLPGSESFALTFLGPAAPLLPQAIYRLDHATLGSFDLFIVPISQDADGLYYEAVFNTIRREDTA